jgi:outer membrane biogenesis lipoprotein LolB
MRRIQILTCIVFMGLLTACSSPAEDAARAQERAFEAQEDVARQRLALVEKYQACVDDAAGDALKTEACDSYLRSAEALK